MSHAVSINGACGSRVRVYCSCSPEEPIASYVGEVTLDVLTFDVDEHITDADRRERKDDGQLVIPFP